MSTQLPIHIPARGLQTEGYCTPLEDKSVQKMLVPPMKVLPIVFLPGIMGSNLRMSADRQALLGFDENCAWRPDDKVTRVPSYMNMSAKDRQLRLDSQATEVDTYDPITNPTGSPGETADKRHDNVAVGAVFKETPRSPLLFDDVPTKPGAKNHLQKARARGWGEVFFSSYGPLLQQLEVALNSADVDKHWADVFDQAPANWGAVPDFGLSPLTKAEYQKATAGTFFPVHAMGYNWLQSNEQSGIEIGGRIASLIDDYRCAGFQCKKVILVTHSMGGLVGRAVVHPDMGGSENLVLGVVHGVMPATGAPATYKRMRCGFEGGPAGVSPSSLVLGHNGPEVTAVLANSPGALQLLPSKAYGNGWLEIRHNKVLFGCFPKNGDPYEEIYKLQGHWYGLLREEWINPSGDPDATLDRTHQYLDDARRFHERIEQTYHPLSFALYGVDAKRLSWDRICWQLSQNFPGLDWNNFHIDDDDKRGRLALSIRDKSQPKYIHKGTALLADPAAPGDQTVPERAAKHQLLSQKFKGVFRQTGYEHQDSYKNKASQSATLYCIVRIAQQMKWA